MFEARRAWIVGFAWLGWWFAALGLTPEPPPVDLPQLGSDIDPLG